MSKVLQAMTEEMRLLHVTVNQQYAEIIKLNRNINALNLETHRRDTEPINLRECLAKYEKPNKNSNNSSTPLSKERIKDEVIRKIRNLRKPSDKKPGGQKGHDGHKLSCFSIPDEIIDEVPNYCACCGESSSDTERVLGYVTQVISIPELKPVIKKVRYYVMVCKNCGEHVWTAPKRRSNDVVYDSSVKTLAVYLSIIQFLSCGHIAIFLCEVFGLTPSEDSLVSRVSEARRNAQPAIDKTKEYIRPSAVVGFDESGLYCKKRLDWAWVAQTIYYTLPLCADGRGSKVLVNKFGNSLERMTTVTDRCNTYFALHFLNHRICLVHLPRGPQYLSKLDTEQEWSGRVINLFRKAIRERNSNPNDVIGKVPQTRRLDSLLKQNIEGFGKEFITLKKVLVRCRDYIFNFLENPMVPFDNNEGEHGTRKLKIKSKNSCTFCSDFETDTSLEFHSIVETAKKRSKTPYNAAQALSKT